jgi:DNA-binding GntR family transcriptional regulator
MPQEHDIYVKLKSAILALTFAPGDTLQEGYIGTLFGVSRTPAREALRALMNEGLVAKCGRFYQVKRFSGEEVRLLYELREALECHAGRLATERASDAQLLELRHQLAEHFESVSHQTCGWATDGSAFHKRLAELSGNELLSRQLDLIHDKVTIFSRIGEREYRDVLLKALEDHFRIVDAMIRRNPIIVEEEIRQHIRFGLELYRRNLSDPAWALAAASAARIDLPT